MKKSEPVGLVAVTQPLLLAHVSGTIVNVGAIGIALTITISVCCQPSLLVLVLAEVLAQLKYKLKKELQWRR